MPTNNSIDAPFPFAATIGGTAQSTYTEGDILYASAANTLSKLGVGSSGEFLGVSGGVPAWATPSGGGGLVVGFSSASSTTATFANTNIPMTGTTPTTSNTTFLISNTYTPTSSTNYLVFDFCAPYNCKASSAQAVTGFFLFQGTTLLTCFLEGTETTANEVHTSNCSYTALSGTTSSTTYSIYYAPVSSSGSSTIFMLSNNGTEFFNSSTATQITFNITEITA